MTDKPTHQLLWMLDIGTEIKRIKRKKMSKNKRMKWSWASTSLSQREATKGRVHHASHLKCRGGWRRGQQIILEKHRGASSWGLWAVTQVLVVTSSALKKQWRKVEWGTLIRIGFLKDNWCFTDRGWIGRWPKIDPQWPLPCACRNPAWWRSRGKWGKECKDLRGISEVIDWVAQEW